MLVSAKEMLQKAKQGKYAVGQFNINNLEWTKAILLTAQENNSPVILGVSEGAGKYMTGYKTVSAMVSAMIEELNITVPVALHLDHGSYEGAKACIEAGFSSIMFDGSHYAIAENIEKTRELVAICNEKGLSLEAEVGSIGGEEDGSIKKGSSVASQDQFELLEKHIIETVRDLGKQILEGKVSAKPFKLGDKSPCVYCSYKTICQFNEKEPDNCYDTLDNLSKQEVWEKIRQREEEN